MRRDHEPIINEHSAFCTCKKWNGPFRLPDEPLGAFTHRANDAHREHFERARQIEQEQTGLFDRQEELFQRHPRVSGWL